MIAKTYSAAFYAAHRPQIPYKVGIKTTGINIVASCVLMLPLKHAGIALGTSIASWAYCYALYRHFPKNLQQLLYKSIKKEGLPILVASIVLVTALYSASPPLATWIKMSQLERISCLFLLILFGIFCYIMPLFVFFRKRSLWQSQIN